MRPTLTEDLRAGSYKLSILIADLVAGEKTMEIPIKIINLSKIYFRERETPLKYSTYYGSII